MVCFGVGSRIRDTPISLCGGNWAWYGTVGPPTRAIAKIGLLPTSLLRPDGLINGYERVSPHTRYCTLHQGGTTHLYAPMYTFCEMVKRYNFTTIRVCVSTMHWNLSLPIIKEHQTSANLTTGFFIQTSKDNMFHTNVTRLEISSVKINSIIDTYSLPVVLVYSGLELDTFGWIRGRGVLSSAYSLLPSLMTLCVHGPYDNNNNRNMTWSDNTII